MKHPGQRFGSEVSIYIVDSVVDSMQTADGTDPLVRAAIDAALAESVGLKTSAIVNDRGLLGESTFDESGDALLDELLGGLGEIANPLPIEAVGVGAIWENTQILELFGLEVTQTTRSTITAINGDLITIDSTTSQSVPAGSVLEAQGQFIEVVSWSSVGTTTAQLDLSRATPLSSTAASQADQVLKADGFEIDQSTVMTLEMIGS